MNLYRIDLTDAHGNNCGAVSDIFGPRLIRQWTVARTVAIESATENPPRFAHITRISGPGHVRRVGIVIPGGATVGRCDR